MALVILSGMEPDEFVRVVRNNDITAMVNLPGIGKKTAERLIVEMRDRLNEWQASEDEDIVSGTEDSALTVKVFSKDAEAALIGLGYKPQQATRAIAQVLKDNLEITDSEELIRLSLKSIV